MTDEEKTLIIQTILGPDAPDTTVIVTYLHAAEQEILAWNRSSEASVPARYEQAQIESVVVGFSMAGSEGQSHSVEGGITRTFKYPTMLDYIHTHVNSGVTLGGVESATS